MKEIAISFKIIFLNNYYFLKFCLMKKQITHLGGCIASVLNRKMKLLVVAAALVTGGLQAQTLVKDTIYYGEVGQTAGVGLWACPTGVTSMTIECWGGGGAGGSALSSNTVSATSIRAKGLGAGGAGGSYSKVIVENPTSGDYAYGVGVGASGLAQASTLQGARSNGSNTYFKNLAMDDIVVAVGGEGGQSCVTDGPDGVLSLGGSKAISGIIGSGFYGGAGGDNDANTKTGGGGGSAGDASDGGDAVLNVAGTAGTVGGAVGASGAAPSAGNSGGAAGIAPGAGGAGGYVRAMIALNATPVYRSGGKGGDGRIIINYTLLSTRIPATKANAFVSVVGKNLLLNGDVNAVEVYNAQGKLIQSQGNVKSVNGLTTGIYIVKMHAPQGVNVQKVSIK